MLSPYLTILRKPGAWTFSAAGTLARLPMSMVTLSIVLLVSAVYGEYALAGRIAAVYVVAQAIAAPQLAVRPQEELLLTLPLMPLIYLPDSKIRRFFHQE